ncbi:MAG: TlpA disulfide reductase family protein [Candidatus Wallbacteria bacterium]|nr:TlpA disulfide reductase family protein [Candidatus Wallbacteria bacterium]
MKIVALILLVLAAAGFCPALQADEIQPDELTMDRVQTPNFSLTYYDDPNKTFTLNDNLGQKNHVFVFFATWCGACQKELPQINAIRNKYPTCDFTAINYRETTQQVTDYFGSASIQLPCLLDKSGSVFKQFGLEYIPDILVVSKTGEQLMLGTKSVEELEALLATLN